LKLTIPFYFNGNLLGEGPVESSVKRNVTPVLFANIAILTKQALVIPLGNDHKLFHTLCKFT
jgi:hypothetical protein